MLAAPPVRSAFHVVVDQLQLDVLVLNQFRVAIVVPLLLEHGGDRRMVVVQDRRLRSSEDLAELHEERAKLAVVLLVGTELEHSMRQRVVTVDEALAEAEEAQRQTFALLALEAHANDGEGVTAAALILMHHQLRLLEADQQQEQVGVAGELCALVRRPQVGERELTHAVDARVVLEDFADDLVDDAALEVQRLAQVRQQLAEDVYELLVARAGDAVVVVLGDVEVRVDELVVSADGRQLAENQQRQLQLHQRKVLLALRVENVPQQVAQDGDRVLEVEAPVFDVKAGFLRRKEDVVDDVGELAGADALLRRSRLVLLNDRSCAANRNAKRWKQKHSFMLRTVCLLAVTRYSLNKEFFS